MMLFLREKKSSNTFLSLPLFTYVCFINLGESSVDHFESLVIQFGVTEVFTVWKGEGSILKIDIPVSL